MDEEKTTVADVEVDTEKIAVVETWAVVAMFGFVALVVATGCVSGAYVITHWPW